MTDLEKEVERLIALKKLIKEKVLKQGEILKLHNKPNVVIEVKKKDTLEAKILKERDACIKNLQEAKISHKKWMSDVQILIELKDVEEAKGSIPINYTECSFGKWYYGKGDVLKVFPEFKQMEANHKNIHQVYLQIYNLYISKLSVFKNKKKQIDKRTIEAKKLALKMDACSKVMFELLIYIENELKLKSVEELKKMLR